MDLRQPNATELRKMYIYRDFFLLVPPKFGYVQDPMQIGLEFLDVLAVMKGFLYLEHFGEEGSPVQIELYGPSKMYET